MADVEQPAGLRRVTQAWWPVLALFGLVITHAAGPQAADHLRGRLKLVLSDDPTLRPGLALLLAPMRRDDVMLRPAYAGEFEAEPFILPVRNKAERVRAVQCMANAVYYEAALEPVAGERAVAQVVLNRLRDQNFPHSICGVVYQGWRRSRGCQFSFTCNGALSRSPNPALFARAKTIAEQALAGYVMRDVGTATHYHAAGVSPSWRTTLVQTTRIGAHIFYRWPGAAGASGAFTQAYQGGELAFGEDVVEGHVRRPPLDVGDSGQATSNAAPSGRTHLTASMPSNSSPPLGHIEL